MDATTRRSFLTVLGGMAASCLSEHASAAPLATGASLPSLRALRHRLETNRSQIDELYLVVRTAILDPGGWTSIGRWIREGESEFLYTPARQILVSRRQGAILTERLEDGEYFRGIEATDGSRRRVLYQGVPSHVGHPSMTLGDFLPIPEDKPSFFLRSERIEGEDQLLFSQGEATFFIHALDPVFVQRIDLYRTERFLERTVEYSSLESVFPGVLFPLEANVTRYKLDGKPLGQLKVSILEITVNAGLPAVKTAFLG